MSHDLRMRAQLEKLANFFKFRRDDFLPSQYWPSLLLSYCNCPPRLKLGFFLFSVAIFLFYRFSETFLKDVTELCRPGHGGRRSGSGRKRIYSSAVVRLVEQVLLHEQEMCFLGSAATVEMGNDRCVGVISQTTRTSKHKGNPARNPVLNLLRPLFRLYDEIGTTDKCTPLAELMHVIIPTKKSHLSTKIHDCTYFKMADLFEFNENGAKVRACAGRTQPL